MDLWVVGGSITSGSFDNAACEAVADYFEWISVGGTHTVTRVDGSGWAGDGTDRPLTTDCDVAVIVGEPFPSYGSWPYNDVKPLGTDCAPMMHLNAYIGDACGLWATVGGNATSDTFNVRNTSNVTWTDGHSVGDDVDVGQPRYSDFPATLQSGAIALLRIGGIGGTNNVYLWDEGTTLNGNTGAGGTSTARVAMMSTYSGIESFDSSAGQQVVNDILTWLQGSVDATATPSVVAATSTVPSPTASVSESRTASPSAVAGSSSVLAPTLSVVEDRTATPSAVAATSTVESPTASVIEDATASPATVAGTSTVESPTAGVTEDRTATPGVVAATSTVETPSISTAGNATVNAAVVAASASVPSPTITVPAIVASPATVDVTAAVLAPSPVVVVDATATPAVVTATAAAPAPSLLALVLAAPASVDATGAVLAPSLVISPTATPETVAALARVLAILITKTPIEGILTAERATALAAAERANTRTTAEGGALTATTT